MLPYHQDGYLYGAVRNLGSMFFAPSLFWTCAIVVPELFIKAAYGHQELDGSFLS
jgi:hypothetical protein